MISKILIANRGEIAIRVVETARKMGIATVSIYSEADVNSPHRFAAEESFCCGKAPSSQSYLDQEKIIDIAKEAKCDAIHPGYGFLSENASFAQRVKDAGIIFIGPAPEAIELMGDKLAAKKLAVAASVPLLPGTESPFTSMKEIVKAARNIGFPVLLKAAGGGGGKGMRIVQNEEELEEQFGLARNEARQSFGDDRIFIEKYLERPRHIEIQLLADKHGNVIHVFERDCSIQRRHQKVIEEAPAPNFSSSLRSQMTMAATRLAKECDYLGAGTVEFLVDEGGDFYFLEMNTRLQVEHPVSEMISGLDLVEWQILIAQGATLPSQEEIECRGHSIELRVYAEDVLDNYAPSLGKIEHLQEPLHEHVRLDGYIEPGFEVPIYYDPLLVKLVVWGQTRDDALSRMSAALLEYRIVGLKTTLALGAFICNHPVFKEGKHYTDFLKLYFEAFKSFLQERASVAANVAATIQYSESKKIVIPSPRTEK